MKKIIGIALIVSFLLTIMSVSRPTTTLNVEFSGLRNNKGQVCMLVFNSEKGYYRNKKAAYKNILVPISNLKATYSLNLPAGEYAIVAIHDENFNQDMDTNLVGMPQEGVAVSNNAVKWWTPQAFSTAKVILSNTDKKISMKMNY